MNRRWASGCLLAVLLLSACGVDAQDRPHEVELPRNSLTSPREAVAADPPGEVGAVYCLVADGRLVQTVRRLQILPTVQQQLEDLVIGPTADEQARGLTTALSGLSLAGRVTPVSREASVAITEADENIARSDEVLAYGQIVCTLTARADVSSVVFSRDGQRLSVPRGDGTLSRSPLRGGDYASLL